MRSTSKGCVAFSYADDLQVQYAIFELENQCFFLLHTSLLLVGVVQELPAQIPDWGMIFIYSKPANKKSSPQEDLTEENLQGEGE